ncbi:MAG: PAS domain-containing sensor histidine kinase [Desulfomonilia bacterium]
MKKKKSPDRIQQEYTSGIDGHDSLMFRAKNFQEIGIRMNQLFDLQPDPTFAIDRSGVVFGWNTAMEELTGIQASAIIGKGNYEYSLPFYGDRRPMLIDSILDPSVEIPMKNGFVKRHGHTLYAELDISLGERRRFLGVKARPIFSSEDQVIGAIESIRDITEFKNTEEALRLSEEKYRNIFENVSDFLFVHDIEGNLIQTNLAWRKEAGYTKDDLAHMKIIDLMPVRYKDLFGLYMQRILEHARDEGLINIATKNGRERVIEYKNILIRDADGNPICVQGSGRDITERLRAEKALKLSKEKYQNILDTIEEGYFEVDLEGNFTFFNRMVGKTLGYTDEELMGMNYRTYMDDSNAQEVFEVFHNVFVTQKPTKAFDWELKKKDGTVMSVEASVSPLKNSKGEVVGFQGMVRDINERKEAERERDRYEMRLAQAQKMEAIGTLAGGIAHDFNNMLSAILGYGELVKNELPQDNRGRSYCDQVLNAALRARELVQQILTFGRMYRAQREQVRVHHIISEVLKLLEATIPTSIEIKSHIDKDSGDVCADPTEIHQIIMNLCTNAYQAMEASVGILTIELNQVVLDEHTLTYLPGLTPGPYVRLVVADTGSGMDENTIKHIFDPFFTTKGKGKGTGLGLATVQRIVKELKGEVVVESQLNKGTSFTIYLPSTLQDTAETNTG